MFSVDLVVRQCVDHLIVALRGELDLADAEEVAAVLAAAAAGRRKMVVDLADLAFIDCRGAAALVRAQRLVRQAGGDLLLAAPRPLVQRVFVLSGLINVVCVHASVEQAIGAGEISGMPVMPQPSVMSLSMQFDPQDRSPATRRLTGVAPTARNLSIRLGMRQLADQPTLAFESRSAVRRSSIAFSRPVRIVAATLEAVVMLSS